MWATVMVVFLSWLAPDNARAERLSHRVRRLEQLSAVAQDIASTDATEEEARLLASIAIHESGVRPDAHGPMGELSAFQIMPPARHYDAAEALRRLREQGLQGYAGCKRPCPRLTAALAKYAP